MGKRSVLFDESNHEIAKFGVKVELYPDNVKVGKQFQHADKRGIPFAIIVGESELERRNLDSKTCKPESK